MKNAYILRSQGSTIMIDPLINRFGFPVRFSDMEEAESETKKHAAFPEGAVTDPRLFCFLMTLNTLLTHLFTSVWRLQKGLIDSNISPEDYLLMEDEVKRLREDNDRLFDALKRSEQDTEFFHSEYAQMKALKEKLEKQLRMAESQRDELTMLREIVYAYQRAGDSINPAQNQGTDINTIIQELRHCRILILGGKPAWIRDLRQIFPDWVFVDFRRATGIADPDIALNADEVFIHTGAISLATKSRFMAQIREHRIPCAFLEGGSVENTIRSIWNHLMKEAS